MEGALLPLDVFRKHYGILQQSVNSPGVLAGCLFSVELIGSVTKDKVNSSNATTFDKAAWLLDAVQKTLVASSQPEDVLKRLCDVLEESCETPLTDVAGRMRAMVEKCSKHTICSGHGPAPCTSATAIGVAIRENFADLQRAISSVQLQELIPELYGRHVLQFDEFESLEKFRKGSSAKSEIVQKIASALEQMIENDPFCLTVVERSVRRFGLLHGVILRIKYEYETHVQAGIQDESLLQDLDTQSSTVSDLSPIKKAEVEIHVPEEPIARRFTLLRAKYTHTFRQIKVIICKHVPLEKLKEQIIGEYSDLEDLVEHAPTADDIMKLLQKKCSFPYLHELGTLVEILKLEQVEENVLDFEEAAEKIRQYEEKRNEVYRDVLAMDFSQDAIGKYDHDNSVMVTFVVNWEKDKTRLGDFEDFLKTVFQFVAKYINLRAVHRSLLMFVCSTPFFLASAVVRVVQESEQLLSKLDVVSIAVGDDVVFKAHSSVMTQTDFGIVEHVAKKLDESHDNVREAFEDGHCAKDDKAVQEYHSAASQHEISLLKKQVEKAEEKALMYQKMSTAKSQESEQLRKLLESKTVTQPTSEEDTDSEELAGVAVTLEEKLLPKKRSQGYCKKISKKPKNDSRETPSENKSTSHSDSSGLQPSSSILDAVDLVGVQEILLKELSNLALIRKSQFGDWYNATWISQNVPVIVNIQKETVRLEENADFLMQASMMSKLKHPNVVQLFGVVNKANQVMLVMEDLDNGFLDHYLQKHQDKLGQERQLKIGLGVASGMSFLAELGYVFRFLKASSIMVSKDEVCKLADFRLARKMTNNEYQAEVGECFAIRWTSLESVMYKRYTVASDVWSFGVLLWEIMTYGQLPYQDMTISTLYAWMQRGLWQRLEQPVNCADEIYQLMLMCWSAEPSERPSFSELGVHMKRMINTMRSGDSNSDY